MIKALSKWFKKDEVKSEKPPLEEIGYETSNLYSYRDFGKYSPDDLLTTKGYGIYNKMMRDDQVKPCMQFKQDAVISRRWHFDVDEENPKHQEMADVFTHIIKSTKGSFNDNLKGILSGMKYGFSITEKVYQDLEIEGKTYWGLKALKLRPFQTFDGGFEVDDHGNILKISQIIGTDTIEIPLEKIIHFVHQPDIDEHFGESDLRSAYRAWWSKDIAIKHWNIYLERLAGGFIIAKTTQGTLSPTQKTNLEQVLGNITSRTGIRLPSNVDMEVISPQRAESFEKALIAYDKAIAKSLLVPNLLGLSEQGQTGSYSQSQTQLDAFFWVLDQIAKRLEELLNEQLFRELAWWNFATDDFPQFKFEPISDDKKIDIAKAWTELIKGGSVTHTDADEAWIRNLMGAPEKPEEEEEEPEEPEGDESLLPLPDDQQIPPEDMPVDMPEQEGWINALPQEHREYVLKEFADKPWLKRINFAQMEGALDRQDESFADEMADILAGVRLKIEKDIIKVAGQRSFGNVKPKEIEGIGQMPKSDKSKLMKVFRNNLTEIMHRGYDMASRELPKRKFRILGGMDKTQTEKFLSSKAMKETQWMSDALIQAVQRRLELAIKYDMTLKQTVDSLADDTDILQLLPNVDAAGRPVNVPARLRNIARTNTADAINQARKALFESPELRGFVVAYEYSAVLDDRTTEICDKLNGRIQRDWGSYAPPNHYQCRSILAPVTMVDDWDGKTDNIPANVSPHKGFA
jgi:SPP1 gp7 family putative phage head morphogenesis protein